MTWEGTIRQATDADGPAIGKLYAECGVEDGQVDWTAPGLAGWWLVAEREGALEGAVQVILSKPWAFVPEVVISPQARGGALGLRLYTFTLALARKAGAQMIYGFLEHGRDARWGEMLCRAGWANGGAFDMLARRLEAA